LLKFPKSQRYSLGAACQKQILDILEAVFMAAGTSETAVKTEQLRLASAKLDLLRLLIRLSKDCKCLTNKQYLEMESKIHEGGRMLGGWLKSLGK
jgi:hypothetical protein